MNQINSKTKGSKPLSEDAKTALKRFELENEIIEENNLYFFDENEIERLYQKRPWK